MLVWSSGHPPLPSVAKHSLGVGIQAHGWGLCCLSEFEKGWHHKCWTPEVETLISSPSALYHQITH